MLRNDTVRGGAARAFRLAFWPSSVAPEIFFGFFRDLFCPLLVAFMVVVLGGRSGVVAGGRFFFYRIEYIQDSGPFVH
jgi:hypothetical protein